MDGGAWQAAVHGVTKSRTRLSDFTFPFHFHALEKEMATYSSVLAWSKSQGWGSLAGCRLWGRTESDTTEATQQQQHQRQTGVSSCSGRIIPRFKLWTSCLPRQPCDPHYCQYFEQDKPLFGLSPVIIAVLFSGVLLLWSFQLNCIISQIWQVGT